MLQQLESCITKLTISWGMYVPFPSLCFKPSSFGEIPYMVAFFRYDLLDICVNGPKEKLDSTVISQVHVFLLTYTI